MTFVRNKNPNEDKEMRARRDAVNGYSKSLALHVIENITEVMDAVESTARPRFNIFDDYAMSILQRTVMDAGASPSSASFKRLRTAIRQLDNDGRLTLERLRRKYTKYDYGDVVMGPIENHMKMRKCLQCNTMFESTHAGNRICDLCGNSAAVEGVNTSLVLPGQTGRHVQPKGGDY